MAYTQTELDALKAAFAAGVLRLTYDGKSVEYGSAEDMLRRISVIEGEIAKAGGRPLPVAGFATSRRAR